MLVGPDHAREDQTLKDHGLVMTDVRRTSERRDAVLAHALPRAPNLRFSRLHWTGLSLSVTTKIGGLVEDARNTMCTVSSLADQNPRSADQASAAVWSKSCFFARLNENTRLIPLINKVGPFVPVWSYAFNRLEKEERRSGKGRRSQAKGGDGRWVSSHLQKRGRRQHSTHTKEMSSHLGRGRRRRYWCR